MKKIVALFISLSFMFAAAPPSQASTLSAPTGFHVGYMQMSKLRLDWNAPTNTGGSKIVDYVIKYSYHDLGAWIPHLVRDAKTANTHVYISNLDLNTTLKFTIWAVNAAGYKSSPAYLTVKTLTPERPVVSDAKTKRQMDYVYKYWNSDATHDGYKQFVGENCTNWVSQVLRARGWSMNKNWWNRLQSNYNWSYSWASATGLYGYLKNVRKNEVTMYSDYAMKYAKIGTVVIFDWYPSDSSKNHSAIVSYIEELPDGSRKIYYAGNTDHTLYRSVIWATTVRRQGGKLVYFNFKD